LNGASSVMGPAFRRGRSNLAGKCYGAENLMEVRESRYGG
jgi:hypothetical protein